jgi:hypothetical protein
VPERRRDHRDSESLSRDSHPAVHPWIYRGSGFSSLLSETSSFREKQISLYRDEYCSDRRIHCLASPTHSTPIMAFANGTQVLVIYQDDVTTAYARVVLGCVDPEADEYVVLTPDGDISIENFADQSIHTVRVKPIGGIPFNFDVANVVPFNDLPSDIESEALFAEAKADIRRLKKAREVQHGLQLRRGRQNQQPVNSEPQQSLVAADQNRSGLGNAAAVPAPVAGVPSVSGGLAALASALNGQPTAEPNVKSALTTTQVPSAEVRVLAVKYDQTGQRFRNFREAVLDAEEIKWDDWPVPGGIFTVLWCMQFMLNRSGSPMLWHQTWVTLGKLNNNDHQVIFHEALCRMVETAACYDQINLPTLASMELLVRQIQCIEERQKDKFTAADFSGSTGYEQHLMAGSSSRSQLCICPALMEWVTKEVAKQNIMDKERRKAREERALTRPPKKGGGDA